jgi:hypothetical protein
VSEENKASAGGPKHDICIFALRVVCLYTYVHTCICTYMYIRVGLYRGVTQ